MTTLKIETRCPDCTSTDVAEFVANWVNPNTDEVTEEYGLAEAYPDLYWCNVCAEAKPGLHETPVIEYATRPSHFEAMQVSTPARADGRRRVYGLESDDWREAGWLMPQRPVCDSNTRNHYAKKRAAGRPVPAWFDEAYPV